MDDSCRICCKTNVIRTRTKKLSANRNPAFPTIYDMIKFCVPNLESPMLPNDWLCFPCLFELDNCVKFIQKCMDTDEKISNFRKQPDPEPESIEIIFEDAEPESDDVEFVPNNDEVHIIHELFEDDDDISLPNNTNILSNTKSNTTVSDIIAFKLNPSDVTNLSLTQKITTPNSDLIAFKVKPSDITKLLSTQKINAPSSDKTAFKIKPTDITKLLPIQTTSQTSSDQIAFKKSTDKSNLLSTQKSSIPTDKVDFKVKPSDRSHLLSKQKSTKPSSEKIVVERISSDIPNSPSTQKSTSYSDKIACKVNPSLALKLLSTQKSKPSSEKIAFKVLPSDITNSRSTQSSTLSSEKIAFKVIPSDITNLLSTQKNSTPSSDKISFKVKQSEISNLLSTHGFSMHSGSKIAFRVCDNNISLAQTVSIPASDNISFKLKPSDNLSSTVNIPVSDKIAFKLSDSSDLRNLLSTQKSSLNANDKVFVKLKPADNSKVLPPQKSTTPANDNIIKKEKVIDSSKQILSTEESSISANDNNTNPMSPAKSSIPYTVVKELMKAYKNVQSTDKTLAAPVQVETDSSLYNLHKVYMCNKCGKVFYCENIFKTHLDTFSSSEDCTYVCNVCNKKYSDVHVCGRQHQICSYCCKVFDTELEFTEHVQTHLTEQCTSCSRGFSNPGQLNIHMLTHKVDMFRQCRQCELVYTQDKIPNHLLNDHRPVVTARVKPELPRFINGKRRRNIPCPICRVVFHTYYKMVNHVLRTDAHANDFPCNLCSNKHTTYLSLKEHIKNDHKVDYFCDKCFAQFENDKNLKNHAQIFQKTKMPCGFSVCEKCNKRFWMQPAYQKHLEMEDCKYYRCKECNKLLTPKAFKIHGHQKYVCEKCGKTFQTSTSFAIHKRSRQHTSETDLVLCETCGKYFAPTYLRMHVKITHSDRPQEYMCSYCSKLFRDRGNLRLHERSHTEVKDIPCKVCGKMFRKPSLMLVHYRAVHLKMRPFKCNECPQAFGQRANLYRHLKIHKRRKLKLQQGSDPKKTPVKRTGRNFLRRNPEMRVKCYFCGKIVKHIEYLKKHVRSYHAKVRDYKCHLCEMTFILKTTLTKHLEHHKHPLFAYRCKICFKTLPNQEDYITHSMKHKLSLECDICHQRFGRKYLLECHKESVHDTREEKLAIYKELVQVALANAVFINDKGSVLTQDDIINEEKRKVVTEEENITEGVVDENNYVYDYVIDDNIGDNADVIHENITVGHSFINYDTDIDYEDYIDENTIEELCI